MLRQGDVLWTVMHFKNGEVRVFEGANTSWLVWPDGSSVKLRKDPADGILDYIEPETATSYDEATSILGRHDIAARLQKTAAAQKSQPVARVATEGKASQKWLNTSPECSSTKLLENLQLIQQQFEAEAAHWHRLNGAANEQTFAPVNNIHLQMDELCKRVSEEKDGTGASYRQPAEAKIAARALDPGLLPIVCAQLRAHRRSWGAHMPKHMQRMPCIWTWGSLSQTYATKPVRTRPLQNGDGIDICSARHTRPSRTHRPAGARGDTGRHPNSLRQSVV